MIAPFHTQLKVGPMLRGESDWRTYVGQFRPAPGEVVGLRRLWALGTWPRINETEFRGETTLGLGSAIVEFAEMTDFFAPLNGHNQTIRRELEKSVHPRWTALLTSMELPPIGIHVRRGDFETASAESDFFDRGALRTPVSWFSNALAALRQQLGRSSPAFVVSDGNRDDLAELLDEPAVQLLQTGSAIGDLLALSRARILLASGGSSFSAWAAYLGEIPSIATPGQSLAWFKLAQGNGALVGEFTPGEAFPRALIEALPRS